MKATFNTKSNFKNVNGKLLNIINANKDYIEVEIPFYGFHPDTNEPNGKTITASFHIKELSGIYSE